MKIALAALMLLALSSAAQADGRPKHCPPRAWCGCWLADYFGKVARNLWVARAWVGEGSPANRDCTYCIAVWPHHVGLVKARDGNKILLLSGNDGRAVRERWRSSRGVIAYRAP